MGHDLATVLKDPIRLAALAAVGMLDTPPDEYFDRLAKLASISLKTPIALVTLVDSDRQFFKSCIGLPEPWATWRQTPLTHSVCQHVVSSGEPLIIDEARDHPLIKDNKAVIELGIRSYLGIPLITDDGSVLGSFCVIDVVPRHWTADELWTLQTLTASVLSEIDLRHHRNTLQQRVNDCTRDLITSNEHLHAELEERHHIEEALRRTIAAARSANEAKDRFLGVLSHELRTPLTPVLLFASAMEKKTDISLDVRDTFALIRQQIELEARLIDDLLDVTAISRGKLSVHLKPLDLHSCIDVVLRNVEPDLFDKRIALVNHLRAESHHVLGDPDRIKQVFSNLLKNAIKFSRPGSTITVRSRNEHGLRAENASTSIAPILCVEVIDQGAGIEADVAAKIFQPFEQGSPAVTREYGGLGLGLAISKALVELHHGQIEVRSDGTGRGSTFAVRFTTIPATHPEQPAAAKVSGVPQRGLSVLVVDDHAQTARAMAKLLQGRGHFVTTAASAEEAIANVQSRRLDIVVCDISLGDGGTGYDVMKALRASGGPPGIALSGHGSQEDITRSQEAGFATHLTKPVDLEQLDAAIRSVVSPEASPDA